MNLAQVKNVDIKEKYQESRSIETEEEKKLLAKRKEKQEVQEKQSKKKADALNNLVLLGVRT